LLLRDEIVAQPLLRAYNLRMAKRVKLPNDIESLKRLVIEQRAALDAVRVTRLSRELEIEKLKIELAQLKRLRFGRSSEKLDERIAQLEHDELLPWNVAPRLQAAQSLAA
jgi:hypothetical protein